MDAKEGCCTTRITIGPYCLRSATSILEFISGKWSFHVISVLEQAARPLRFHEVKEKLAESEAESVSPRTLTARLRKAEELGLIIRSVFAEVPPRVEYELTASGKAFCDSILPLLEWVSKWGHCDCAA